MDGFVEAMLRVSPETLRSVVHDLVSEQSTCSADPRPGISSQAVATQLWWLIISHPTYEQALGTAPLADAVRPVASARQTLAQINGGQQLPDTQRQEERYWLRGRLKEFNWTQWQPVWWHCPLERLRDLVGQAVGEDDNGVCSAVSPSPLIRRLFDHIVGTARSARLPRPKPLNGLVPCTRRSKHRATAEKLAHVLARCSLAVVGNAIRSIGGLSTGSDDAWAIDEVLAADQHQWITRHQLTSTLWCVLVGTLDLDIGDGCARVGGIRALLQSSLQPWASAAHTCRIRLADLALQSGCHRAMDDPTASVTCQREMNQCRLRLASLNGAQWARAWTRCSGNHLWQLVADVTECVVPHAGQENAMSATTSTQPQMALIEQLWTLVSSAPVRRTRKTFNAQAQRSEALGTVYVLRLIQGYVYVGFSEISVPRRLAQHCSGSGAEWTSCHGPVALECVWRNVPKSDERVVTLDWMAALGVSRVRGAGWTRRGRIATPVALGPFRDRQNGSLCARVPIDDDETVRVAKDDAVWLRARLLVVIGGWPSRIVQAYAHQCFGSDYERDRGVSEALQGRQIQARAAMLVTVGHVFGSACCWPSDGPYPPCPCLVHALRRDRRCFCVEVARSDHAPDLAGVAAWRGGATVDAAWTTALLAMVCLPADALTAIVGYLLDWLTRPAVATDTCTGSIRSPRSPRLVADDIVTVVAARVPAVPVIHGNHATTRPEEWRGWPLTPSCSLSARHEGMGPRYSSRLAADGIRTAADVVNYALSCSLQSLTAAMRRWCADPNGGQISPEEDGSWRITAHTDTRAYNRIVLALQSARLCPAEFAAALGVHSSHLAARLTVPDWLPTEDIVLG